ncbi:hypothetical protein LguiB_006093 [Lonicera macranthoides]
MGDEHDKLLPIANVVRIMKQILPPKAKISKEAKETIQECASEFISFVTGEASNKCHRDNRKTVNGHDVCWALISLGFDEYGEVIMKYLHKYMEFERERIARAKQRTVIEEKKDEDSMCRVPECRRAFDKCHKDNRKTVNGHDVCWALIFLGFDEYGEVIMKYLHKYMEFERERAAQKKGGTL